MALLFLDAHGTEDAVTYLTVYFIERSLSLDNLFVFLLLFAYFGVPTEHRARLLFWGIAAALVLRGLAILGGVALLEQLHFFIYVLGVLLLFLAYRILRGVEDNVDPDNNFVVKLVRKVFPVSSDFHGKRWFVKQEGTRYATPMFVCLAAIVAADIAFAIDSIPAAFAITRDSVLIWMGNIFALLGLRALFVLVEGLIRRFRYLDETIAIVLGIVAIKLLDRGPLQGRAGDDARDRLRRLRDRDRRLADRRPQRPGRRGEARAAHGVAGGLRPAVEPLAPELAQLALDLRLDVQRRLAARLAAAVARHHQLAHLLSQAGVDRRRGQPLELVLDVELRLAAGDGAGVARAEHLADLGVALDGVDRAAARRRRPDLPIVADAAAPDLVVEAAAEEEGGDREHDRDPDHDEDHDAEGVLHPPPWSHVAAASTPDRWPGGARLLFEGQYALALVTAIVMRRLARARRLGRLG